MLWGKGEEIELATSSSEKLLVDIRKYFGHRQNDLSILPNVIILHGKFAVYSQIPDTQDRLEEKRKLKSDIFTQA